MLVITDYATRYPEVFPLRSLKAKHIPVEKSSIAGHQHKVHFACWDQLGMLVCWWTSICCLLGAGMIPARPQQNLCICYISRVFIN